MKIEEMIDEIDWLISEMTPGAEVESCHECSFEAIGIQCGHKRLSRSTSQSLIDQLKNKRESLT